MRASEFLVIEEWLDWDKPAYWNILSSHQNYVFNDEKWHCSNNVNSNKHQMQNCLYNKISIMWKSVLESWKEKH